MVAPPDEDFVALLARVGVAHVPLGSSVRSLVGGAKPPTAEDARRFAAELVAARFDTLMAAAQGCAALLATGLMPAGARDVAEKLGLRYVFASRQTYGLPPRRGTGEPDAGVERANALYREPLNRHRAAIGLPPVDNVRDHIFTERPWLAADPVLCPPQGRTDLDVAQTGAWILPDDRPLPDDHHVIVGVRFADDRDVVGASGNESADPRRRHRPRQLGDVYPIRRRVNIGGVLVVRPHLRHLSRRRGSNVTHTEIGITGIARYVHNRADAARHQLGLEDSRLPDRSRVTRSVGLRTGR